MNFYPSSKEEFEKLSKIGEIINHNGKFVVQEGETTGHKHVLSVPDIDSLVAVRLPDGSVLLHVKEEGSLTHEDHKKIDLAPGYYREVREREVDHFGESVVRQVID